MTRPGLLADENIAAPMVSALREAGWDVLYIPEQTPGVTDEEVLALVRNERRVLLTEDKDFGELVFRLKRDVTGIVLLRLPEGTWDRRWPRAPASATFPEGEARSSACRPACEPREPAGTSPPGD